MQDISGFLKHRDHSVGFLEFVVQVQHAWREQAIFQIIILIIGKTVLSLHLSVEHLKLDHPLLDYHGLLLVLPRLLLVLFNLVTRHLHLLLKLSDLLGVLVVICNLI